MFDTFTQKFPRDYTAAYTVVWRINLKLAQLFIYEGVKVIQGSTIRLQAKKGPAHPLGNFADISYLKEQSKLRRIRDACTL